MSGEEGAAEEGAWGWPRRPLSHAGRSGAWRPRGVAGRGRGQRSSKRCCATGHREEVAQAQRAGLAGLRSGSCRTSKYFEDGDGGSGRSACNRASGGRLYSTTPTISSRSSQIGMAQRFLIQLRTGRTAW